MDVIYIGSLTTSLRTKVYEGEILRETFKYSSALVPDTVSPLNIGCTHSSDNRPFGGYINEVIIYTVTVNDAQHIIVNNYLFAKNNVALSANDKYAGIHPQMMITTGKQQAQEKKAWEVILFSLHLFRED